MHDAEKSFACTSLLNFVHTIYVIDHKISSWIQTQFMGLMISNIEEASASKQTHKSLE